MKRFYVFWFFFCAGWGYLMAGFSPPENYNPIIMVVGSFVVGALMFFLFTAIEFWRVPNGRKIIGPSLKLKPWSLPFGIPVFVLITFLFSSIWGLPFAILISSMSVSHPAQFLSLSTGGLLGIYLSTHVFSSRIAS